MAWGIRFGEIVLGVSGNLYLDRAGVALVTGGAPELELDATADWSRIPHLFISEFRDLGFVDEMGL